MIQKLVGLKTTWKWKKRREMANEQKCLNQTTKNI